MINNFTNLGIGVCNGVVSQLDYLMKLVEQSFCKGG